LAPHTGGDGGNLAGPVAKRNPTGGLPYSGSGGGGAGTGDNGDDDGNRRGVAGSGGRCIIRWTVEQYTNATSTSGTVFFNETSGYRYFDFIGSGSITI
jgi:hypothetical protein